MAGISILRLEGEGRKRIHADDPNTSIALNSSPGELWILVLLSVKWKFRLHLARCSRAQGFYTQPSVMFRSLLESDRCWILISLWCLISTMFSFVLLILGCKYLYTLRSSVIYLSNEERKESHFSCSRKTSSFTGKAKISFNDYLARVSCIRCIYTLWGYISLHFLRKT